MEPGWIVQPSPHDEPKKTEASRHSECRTPSPSEIDPQHDERGDRTADRGPAVEQGGCEAALVFGEPFRDRLGGCGPVCRFTSAKTEAEAAKTIEPIRQRP